METHADRDNLREGGDGAAALTPEEIDARFRSHRLEEDAAICLHELGRLYEPVVVPKREIVALLERADRELDASRPGFPKRWTIEGAPPRYLLRQYVLTDACACVGWDRTK